MPDLFTIASASTTFVLAVITGYYAWTTRKILTEMQNQSMSVRRQTEATQESLKLIRWAGFPELNAIHSSTPNAVQFDLRNRGEVSAQNIKLKLIPEPDKVRYDLPSKALLLGAGRDQLVKIHIPKSLSQYSGILQISSKGRYGISCFHRWKLDFHRDEKGVLRIDGMEFLGVDESALEPIDSRDLFAPASY
ncbi:MAG: hypothetical protein K8R59_16400 [Thermoanaerobaculales bacterium]|nr:hypothetical protein [Thermoanaerobaculales bacterium]